MPDASRAVNNVTERDITGYAMSRQAIGDHKIFKQNDKTV
jgi:hypothetical protein